MKPPKIIAGIGCNRKDRQLKKWCGEFELTCSSSVWDVTSAKEITSENLRIVADWARRVKIDHLLQGMTDQAKAMRELCESLGLELSQEVYVGDDNNDLEVLRTVEISAAPAAAIAEVRSPVHHVYQRKGGEGCARELVNLVLV